MKVLYKNKVGNLVPLEGYTCQNYIYYQEHWSIIYCRIRGLRKLCVGSEFILSSSDVLTYEN